MAKFIRIPVPKEYDEDPDDFDLKAYFQDQISDEFGDPSGDLLRALDLSGGTADEQRVHMHSVQVEAVTADARGIGVECSAEFSVHYGCDDMNKSWEDDAFAAGTREGSDWVFPVFQRPERLAPNEEL